ncbi:MAG TPA: hypothetical protein VE289_08670 [Gaiellaceae bacterium]|nr:hypothetical protein [Gaiellaceae bacterium]
MRKSAPLHLALIAALAIAGCGGSDDPKRAVDARTEALHFFPADQPFVALLDTSTPDRPALGRAVRALRGAGTLEAFTGYPALLPGNEVELAPLAELMTDEDPDDGLADSQAAMGLSGRTGEDVLLVLVSERTEEMEDAAEEVAQGLGLNETDGFHEARVFAGDALALAVRDGVVLLAPGIARLRAALVLRDSNQDEQLDEDQIADLLRELPAGTPLVAYANFALLEGNDPAVGLLALGERSWMRALRDTAIAVAPEPGRLRVEVFAEVESEEAGAIPFGEEPQEVEVVRAKAGRLVGGNLRQPSAFRDAVVALAPFVARASLTDEEVRATVIGSR